MLKDLNSQLSFFIHIISNQSIIRHFSKVREELPLVDQNTIQKLWFLAPLPTISSILPFSFEMTCVWAEHRRTKDNSQPLFSQQPRVKISEKAIYCQ